MQEIYDSSISVTESPFHDWSNGSPIPPFSPHFNVRFWRPNVPASPSTTRGPKQPAPGSSNTVKIQTSICRLLLDWDWVTYRFSKKIEVGKVGNFQQFPAGAPPAGDSGESGSQPSQQHQAGASGFPGFPPRGLILKQCPRCAPWALQKPMCGRR